MPHEFEYLIRESLRDKGVDEYGRERLEISQKDFSEILVDLAVRIDEELERLRGEIADIKAYVIREIEEVVGTLKEAEGRYYESVGILVDWYKGYEEGMRIVYNMLRLLGLNVLRIYWQFMSLYRAIKPVMNARQRFVFLSYIDRNMKELCSDIEDLHSRLCKIYGMEWIEEEVGRYWDYLVWPKSALKKEIDREIEEAKKEIGKEAQKKSK